MPHFSARPTMRSVAAAAGVSPMAVSLALRDDPSIPARTRTRIQRVAKAQGYRPDPVLTHLMQHLRSSRKTRAAANLAVFTPLQAPFTQRLIAGAEARAARLGYALNRIDLSPFERQPGGLTRILLARGITGLLLAPAASPRDYSDL